MRNPRKGDKIGPWTNLGNDFKPNNPIWDQWVNMQTGETSQKVIRPRIILDTEGCEHVYISVGRQDVQCKYCGDGRTLSFPYELKNGKIKKMKLNIASNSSK